jgi:hypothetical protein
MLGNKKYTFNFIILYSSFMGSLFPMKKNELLYSKKCSICLESLSLKKHTSITLNCKHEYCTPCIWKWAHESQNCPLCRSPFQCTISPEHIKAMPSYEIKKIMSNARGLFISQHIIENMQEGDIKKVLMLAGGIAKVEPTPQTIPRVIHTNQEQTNTIEIIDHPLVRRPHININIIRGILGITGLASLYIALFSHHGIHDGLISMFQLFLAMVAFYGFEETFNNPEHF